LAGLTRTCDLLIRSHSPSGTGVCVLNFLFGLPGLLFAPGAALKALIAVTEVVALLIMVLVVLPSSRRALASAEQPSSRVR
jgi:hypothetical protein